MHVDGVVQTVFLAGTSPNIRSYTVYIYDIVANPTDNIRNHTLCHLILVTMHCVRNHTLLETTHCVT